MVVEVGRLRRAPRDLHELEHVAKQLYFLLGGDTVRLAKTRSLIQSRRNRCVHLIGIIEGHVACASNARAAALPAVMPLGAHCPARSSNRSSRSSMPRCRARRARLYPSLIGRIGRLVAPPRAARDHARLQTRVAPRDDGTRRHERDGPSTAHAPMHNGRESDEHAATRHQAKAEEEAAPRALCIGPRDACPDTAPICILLSIVR